MTLDESTPSRAASGSVGHNNSSKGQSVYDRYRADLDETPVELGSDGLSTGVELEVSGDPGEVDGQITAPFDPEQIDIQTRNSTVDLLLSRIKSDMIDLAPDFQRKAGIWDDGRQSRLIESLLLKIPIPSFYAAELDDTRWAMVDGIQRLTTITRFIAPASIGAQPLRLTGLEYLQDDFNGAAYADLSGRLQIRLRETEVVVHLIRKGTPEAVKFNIFARINTGGLPLTRQEIRHALVPGRARSFLAELADSDAFRTATAYSVSSERMTDREMVLRFIAFRLQPPSDFRSDDFDQYLAFAMRAVNRLPEEALSALRDSFEHSMGAAAEIFGENAFRKRRRDQPRKPPINKAVFETVAVNLADLDSAERAELVRSRNAVIDAFHDLVSDSEFDRSVSVGTGDRRKVHTRFDAVRKLFRGVLDYA